MVVCHCWFTTLHNFCSNYFSPFIPLNLICVPYKSFMQNFKLIGKAVGKSSKNTSSLLRISAIDLYIDGVGYQIFTSYLEICMNNLYVRDIKFNSMIGKKFEQRVMEDCKSLLTYNLCQRIPSKSWWKEMSFCKVRAIITIIASDPNYLRSVIEIVSTIQSS